MPDNERTGDVAQKWGGISADVPSVPGVIRLNAQELRELARRRQLAREAFAPGDDPSLVRAAVLDAAIQFYDEKRERIINGIDPAFPRPEPSDLRLPEREFRELGKRQELARGAFGPSDDPDGLLADAAAMEAREQFYAEKARAKSSSAPTETKSLVAISSDTADSPSVQKTRNPVDTSPAPSSTVRNTGEDTFVNDYLAQFGKDPHRLLERALVEIGKSRRDPENPKTKHRVEKLLEAALAQDPDFKDAVEKARDAHNRILRNSEGIKEIQALESQESVLTKRWVELTEASWDKNANEIKAISDELSNLNDKIIAAEARLETVLGDHKVLANTRIDYDTLTEWRQQIVDSAPPAKAVSVAGDTTPDVNGKAPVDVPAKSGGITSRVAGIAGKAGKILDNTHGRAAAALGVGGAAAEMVSGIIEGDTEKASKGATNLAVTGSVLTATTEAGQKLTLQATRKIAGEAAEAGLEKVGAAIVAKTTAKIGGKAIPLVGAFISGGFALWDVGSHLIKGEFSKAGAELAAGTAEVAGQVVGTFIPVPGLGLAVGDALRQGTVEAVAYGTGVRASDASLVAMGKLAYSGVTYMTSSGTKEVAQSEPEPKPKPKAIPESTPPVTPPVQVADTSVAPQATAQPQSFNGYVAPQEEPKKQSGTEAIAQSENPLFALLAFLLSIFTGGAFSKREESSTLVASLQPLDHNKDGAIGKEELVTRDQNKDGKLTAQEVGSAEMLAQLGKHLGVNDTRDGLEYGQLKTNAVASLKPESQVTVSSLKL